MNGHSELKQARDRLGLRSVLLHGGDSVMFLFAILIVCSDWHLPDFLLLFTFLLWILFVVADFLVNTELDRMDNALKLIGVVESTQQDILVEVSKKKDPAIYIVTVGDPDTAKSVRYECTYFAGSGSVPMVGQGKHDDAKLFRCAKKKARALSLNDGILLVRKQIPNGKELRSRA